VDGESGRTERFGFSLKLNHDSVFFFFFFYLYNADAMQSWWRNA